MLVAQISDFHVTADDRPLLGRVRTPAALARAVATVSGLESRPDLVIATGDLTEGGTEGEYARVRELVASLPAPFLPVLGNHDDRLVFRQAFADLLPPLPAAFVQYAVDGPALTVVAIDTVTPGSGDPSFCAARAVWLDEALAAARRPVLLAMHHPPMPTGITWMDPPDSSWSTPIARAVERSGRVCRIVCGHIHRVIQAQWAGVPVSTAPSTAHQVALSFTRALPAFTLEPPGFLLHRFDGDSASTYFVATDGALETFSPCGAPTTDRHA